MDLITNRTKEIGAMALDGLYARQKAIGANTVNVLTPDYQRKEVSFEGSLRDIIAREDAKENLKVQNSENYKKHGSSVLLGQSPEQIAFLNSQTDAGFSIDVEADQSEPIGLDNNNVNIETEMMDEARTGMQYQVVANLLSKSYSQLNAVIRGQNS